ncbi:hypothetical protein KSS87_000948 [Heliosperma pusillum]|nr:hypothetical protein KSS87_000948 [Heliosperma pusillum]
MEIEGANGYSPFSQCFDLRLKLYW